MNIAKLIARTDLPAAQRTEVEAVFKDAKQRAKGLFWGKWRLRLWEYKELADMLSWESERLVEIDPNLIAKDIAPTLSVTCYGDHIDWDPATGRPKPGIWLNKDPESAEYKHALAATKGKYTNLHPRSGKFHRFWYRRNAGEGLAWMRGMPVDMPNRPTEYNGKDVRLLRSGDAWQLIAFKPLIGPFGLRISLGYEIANVWNFDKDAQGHYPLPGWELRAPLTWSILPGRA